MFGFPSKPFSTATPSSSASTVFGSSSVFPPNPTKLKTTFGTTTSNSTNSTNSNTRKKNPSKPNEKPNKKLLRKPKQPQPFSSHLPAGIPPEEAEAYFQAIGGQNTFLGQNSTKKPKAMVEEDELEEVKEEIEEDPLNIEAQDMAQVKDLHGKCIHLCSEKESEFRTRVDELSAFEKPLEDGSPVEIIKRFQRSSASHKLDIPSEIRPPGILRRAQLYLEQNLMDREKYGDDPRIGRTPDLIELYNFCWDRTRMIRKDFVLQNYIGGGRSGSPMNPIVLDVHERIARYHILCEHELIEEKNFVQQQNMEQLGQTLKSLNELYDDLSKDTSIESSPFESEFRGYYILCTLQNGRGLDVLKYVMGLSRAMRQSKAVKFAMRCFNSFHQDDYYSFLQCFRKGTYLTSCLLHRYLPRIRSNALHHMNKAYRNTSFPVHELVDVLCFENPDHLIETVQLHGLSLVHNNQKVKFGLGEFLTEADIRKEDGNRIPNPFSHRFIGVKKGNYLRGDLCRGITEYEIYPKLPSSISHFEKEEQSKMYPNLPAPIDKYSQFSNSSTIENCNNNTSSKNNISFDKAQQKKVEEVAKLKAMQQKLALANEQKRNNIQEKLKKIQREEEEEARRKIESEKKKKKLLLIAKLNEEKKKQQELQEIQLQKQQMEEERMRQKKEEEERIKLKIQQEEAEMQLAILRRKEEEKKRRQFEEEERIRKKKEEEVRKENERQRQLLILQREREEKLRRQKEEEEERRRAIELARKKEELKLQQKIVLTKLIRKNLEREMWLKWCDYVVDNQLMWSRSKQHSLSPDSLQNFHSMNFQQPKQVLNNLFKSGQQPCLSVGTLCTKSSRKIKNQKYFIEKFRPPQAQQAKVSTSARQPETEAIEKVQNVTIGIVEFLEELVAIGLYGNKDDSVWNNSISANDPQLLQPNYWIRQINQSLTRFHNLHERQEKLLLDDFMYKMVLENNAKQEVLLTSNVLAYARRMIRKSMANDKEWEEDIMDVFLGEIMLTLEDFFDSLKRQAFGDIIVSATKMWRDVFTLICQQMAENQYQDDHEVFILNKDKWETHLHLFEYAERNRHMLMSDKYKSDYKVKQNHPKSNQPKSVSSTRINSYYHTSKKYNSTDQVPKLSPNNRKHLSATPQSPYLTRKRKCSLDNTSLLKYNSSLTQNDGSMKHYKKLNPNQQKMQQLQAILSTERLEFSKMLQELEEEINA